MASTRQRCARVAPAGLATLTHLLASFFVSAAPPPAWPAEPRSEGQALFVTANLQEAYGDEDMKDLGEMSVFVDRLLAHGPGVPDVLPLQEVRNSSADRVAELLQARTGSRFAVVVDPGPRPSIRITDTEFLHTETAILVNTLTMRSMAEGGYLRTPYARWAGIPDHVVVIRQQAFALLEDRSSGTRYAVANVHYVPRSAFRSPSASHLYRDKWSRAVADNLRARYGGLTDAYVVGGDFNQDMCAGEVTYNCSPLSPYYLTLMQEPYRLTDAVRSIIRGHGVDLVFTDAQVLDAGRDSTYSWRDVEGDPSRFYADHQFRWSLLKG